MVGFKLVLHGTEVEPGKPAPSSPSHYSPPLPPIHHNSLDVTHQDLTHKDTNTQVGQTHVTDVVLDKPGLMGTISPEEY